MRFLSSSTRRKQWLLLSDIHFRAHDLDRIQRTARWIESLPKPHDIQRVVVCGDLLTSRTNQPTHVLSACYRFLSNLIDTVPHVDILLGNHDLAHKRDYVTTALDVLSVRRLAPYVKLHSDVSSLEWDGRRVLILPFRDDQTELTAAVSSLDPRDAAETVGFAHLAIHKAVMQRHVVHPQTGELVRPITYRGITGPSNFAALARTFTGHFHSHQTIVQPSTGTRPDVDHLQGSVTYIGSPLQLTWADLHDEQRGVMLLDPVTLHQELLVNPHAVDFVAANVDKVLANDVNPDSVVGKHVMLIGDLTRFKYVNARDKLLLHGARSVRNWRPMTPVMQLGGTADDDHTLGASVPASDNVLSGGPQENGGDAAGRDPEAAEPRGDTRIVQEEPEPVDAQLHSLHLAQHAREYVEALELDPSISPRRSELIRVGHRLIQACRTEADASALSYQEIAKAATASSLDSSVTANDNAPGDTAARHVFVAQPQTITITNFLGVQDTVTIDFRNLLRGLVFVVGANGSGKSTLVEAITWCQFGRCVRGGLTVNDVVNDVAGKNCHVSLTFENGYTITRYRKDKTNGNRVVVSLRGEPQMQIEKDDQRSTQAAIDELLGIDYETYVRTVILGHESAAGFLGSTALQRRELIEPLLGLSAMNEFSAITRRMVKDVDADVAELQGQRDGITRTIQHVEGRMADLETRQKQVQRKVKDATKALEVAQEQISRAQEERDRIMGKILLNQSTADRAIADLQDRVDHARRELDMLGTRVQVADIRIAFDHEQSIDREKVYDAPRRLHNLRLAGAGTEPPSSWRWRFILVAIDTMGRLQQWLARCLKETSFKSQSPEPIDYGRRFTRWWASGCLVAVVYMGNKLRSIKTAMVEFKQLSALEQLNKAFATTEQELNTVVNTSEHVAARVALARGVDEQQVRQIISSMSTEECRAIKKQQSDASGRLSLLTAECNQTMQQTMRQRQSDRSYRDELDTNLATLRDNAMVLQSTTENAESQASTYAHLLQTEAQSLSCLRRHQSTLETQAGLLASSRELFAFWESASSRRRGGTTAAATTNFRGYVLGRSLDELNGLLAQILMVLFDDTRHVRGMASGMLRSLFVKKEDDNDNDDNASRHGGDGGVVLNESLGINSALSYAKRSGGERKRIDLAVFFALLHLSHLRSRHRARYLLVDEVFDSLDVAGQAVVVRWCRSVMARMDFVMVVTHSEYMAGDEGNGGSCVRVKARMGEGGTVFEFQR